MFACSTHDFIMLFTNKGKVFKMKGYEIPESSRTGKGMNVVNILPIEQGEQITAMVRVPKDEERSFLCMMTKNGIIKRTALDQYQPGFRAGGRDGRHQLAAQTAALAVNDQNVHQKSISSSRSRAMM